MNKTLYLLLSLTLGLTCLAETRHQKTYEIWDTEQASNRGPINSRGYDSDWERLSYPIGNGYAGANLFGRTDTDRVQLTEKTLYTSGQWGYGAFTNFAELYLDFNHDAVTNYRRSLNLNEGIAYVSYDHNGVHYTREYFMSYPDQVLVIHFKASEPESLSLKVRPEIPYLRSKKHKTGTVTAEGDVITLAGSIAHFSVNYEAQVKVLHEGGRSAIFSGTAGEGLELTNVDEATIIVALGTNYELSPSIFKGPNESIKLDANVLPHAKITGILQQAVQQGYAQLKERHLKDHSGLFDRVAVNLNTQASPLPTPQLLQAYKDGKKDPYLEELMFQYGRYLLIASSREKSLPSGLQGAWNQYEGAPWTGGYWHNINIQMNYWGALNTNLAETFVSYLNYFQAYYPQATKGATSYLEQHHPERLSSVFGENGWSIGTGANPYQIGKPGGHSGPGTGALTSKLLMEYYNFTLDRTALEEIIYPGMRGMSQFLSKTLIPGENNTLLVKPSASPEQTISRKKAESLPGHLVNGKYYSTIGCTFDQGAVWENHNDVLKIAKILGINDPFIQQLKEEMPRLDPILIGDSGQIKEFREEGPYGEIGEKRHRHISHLCTLFPGTLINASKPEWMKAASFTLDRRGDNTTGWAMAHRMNCRARLKQGDKALKVYQKFIAEKTVPNLWTLHPPFQIDGNFGVMAGMAEMLLQSHTDVIDVLPALPKAWSEGSFEGLVARGNFVVDALWKDGKATHIAVTSRSGGLCRIQYPNLAQAKVNNPQGHADKVQTQGTDLVTFPTKKGERYVLSLNP